MMANNNIKNNIVKADSILKVGQRLSFFSDDDNMYTSRIEDMSDKELIVAMPMDKKRRPIIPVKGAHLYGAVLENHCQFRFFSTFREKGLQNNVPVWYISRPEKLERHQNREFVRVRISKTMQVQMMDEEGGFLPPEMVSIVDISGSGLAFNSKREAHIESQIIMEIRNLPDIGQLRVMGRVMRCNRIDTQSDERLFQIGVKMLNLDRPTRNKLVHYIFEIQRQELKKGLDTTGVKQ